MPTIHVNKKTLFNLLGREFTFEELEILGFEFGIEVEERENEPEKYSFELASNRNDLLSVEGLAQALAVYLGIREQPNYKILNKLETREKLVIKPSTKQIRPYCVCAILRDVKFTEENYASFIDLQDKLHSNIGRKRTLVSMGTHDYDTIKGPFRYEALPPQDIKFVPLNKEVAVNGIELMELYQTDSNLKQFLSIIRDSPVYPVIYDSNNIVLSLPPIINGNHSKITLNTTNVFIEITATDHTKAKVALNTVVALFSQYCGNQYTVEEVEVVDEQAGKTEITPDISHTTFQTNLDYINKVVGIEISSAEVINLLKKMGLSASKLDEQSISVSVPITRHDILHECDIAEDVAIAYGYNNIVNKIPSSHTVGGQLLINKFSDLLRNELAQAGYKECLNFALCSLKEITTDLQRKVDGTHVTNANPKSQDFQVGRTTLIPGLLKTLSSNKMNKHPIKLFELSDVVLKDDNEVGARNERRLAALIADINSSNLEYIHGLLDYIMLKMRIPNDAEKGYSIVESNDSTYFPGRQVNIFYKGQNIGQFGIVHPVVLKNFDLTNPTSLIEINIEPLVRDF